MFDDGMLLRMYIAESAKIGKKPAYKFLVEFFLSRGFPGCTVTRGITGFGHEHTIHTVDVLNFSFDLPLVIDVIDTRERILSIAEEIEREGYVKHGLIMLQDVRMSRKA